MKRFCLYIIILITLLILSGCGKYGLIYSHVKTPLDTNMNKTPIQIKSAEGDIRHVIVILQAGFGFLAALDSAAVGEIAKRHDIKTVYYSDLEEVHVLSLFATYTVHIYGK